MATPEEKHNCFLLNLFKGRPDTSSTRETTASSENPETTVNEASVSAGSGQDEPENTSEVSSSLPSDEELMNKELELFASRPAGLYGSAACKV